MRYPGVHDVGREDMGWKMDRFGINLVFEIGYVPSSLIYMVGLFCCLGIVK